MFFCVAVAVPFYNEEDVKGIRAACRLGREILDLAHRAVRPGITTGV
jgi:methionyl aminopeptidase